jgi:hypothetical protein
MFTFKGYFFANFCADSQLTGRAELVLNGLHFNFCYVVEFVPLGYTVQLQANNTVCARDVIFIQVFNQSILVTLLYALSV